MHKCWAVASVDILGQEQLELARAQVDGLERRNAEIKNQLEEAQIVRKEEVWKANQKPS